MIRRCVPVLLIISAAACAQPERPPGGPEDRVPPVVIETIPDTFALVEPGAREFFFRFNERISERPSAGQLNNAVVISPSVGAVRVRHGRDGIRIEAQEGLETGRLYRVTVLPVINDMFSNTLRDPFDLVLSTGEEFIPNVVAGMVEDRITGQAVPDARVTARFGEGDDTLTHWNFTGADGVFSMRYVPGAPFEVRAWQDRDRNAEVGEFEPQSAISGGEFARSPDTTFTILSLIEPDTTPARLASVTVEDSLTLNFEFDDYLEPQLPGVVFNGRLVLARLTDSAAVAAEEDSIGAVVPEDTVVVADPEDTVGVAEPEVIAAAAEPGDTVTLVEPGDSLVAQPGDSVQVEIGDTVTVPPGKDTITIRFYHPHEYELRTREVADSIAQADERALADSLAQLGQLPPPAEEPPADSVEAPPGPVGLSGQLLPTQTLIGILEEALVRGAPYEASMSGVLNIAGTSGGGGTAVVVWELPPPDTTTADSTLIADSLGVGDSLTVGDSVQVGDTTDTTGAGPDTTRVGPDTTRAGPDTTTVGAPPFARSSRPRLILWPPNSTRRRAPIRPLPPRR